MKQLQAIVASIVVTGLIACVTVVIGGSALFSRPAVSVSAATNAETVSSNAAPDASADTAQLRDLVNQYQGREQQLRAQLADVNKQLDEKDAQLSQANAQLDGANQQIQQFQNLLEALQERGIIQITGDGRIRISSR